MKGRAKTEDGEDILDSRHAGCTAFSFYYLLMLQSSWPWQTMPENAKKEVVEWIDSSTPQTVYLNLVYLHFLSIWQCWGLKLGHSRQELYH